MTTENITIKVSADDIARAITKDSARCVVATAIAREIPGAHRITVDVQAIRFTNEKGDRITYLTPPAVTGYVVAFDAGDPIGPFRFLLRGDQRFQVKKSVRTEAGMARQRAARKVTARGKAAAKVAADPTATPTAKRAARERVATAEQERVDVVAAYQDQQGSEWDDPSLPPPIPQVFRRGERAYGLRRLRINQHGTFAERLADDRRA